MHFLSVLSILGIASYTFANPLVGDMIRTPVIASATSKAKVLARQATPTHDVSVVEVTIPAITHGPHGGPPQPDRTIAISIPTCSMTAVPDQNGHVPPGTCHSYYDYYPSFGFALLFTILFGSLTALHITQAAVYKKRFCWVICMAAIWELGAFFTRTLSTKNQQSVGLVFISQVLVLLAPLWVNAFDYMLFARMVHYFLPTKSLFGIRAGTFAIVFVALDVVAFVIQLVGGTTAGPNDSADQIQKGIHIYMGGIGLQEFFIVCFLGLVVRFQLEVGKLSGKDNALTGAGGVWDGKARRLLWTLYASMGFITVRIIWRLVEHSQPPSPSSPFLANEWLFYVLEALPMFAAIGIMNITHPGTVLKGPESNLPKSKIWRQCACCGARKRKAQSEKYVEIEMGHSKGSEASLAS